MKELLRRSFGRESAVHSSANQSHFTLINDAHDNHLELRFDILTQVDEIREYSRLHYGRTALSEAQKELYKVPNSGFDEQGVIQRDLHLKPQFFGLSCWQKSCLSFHLQPIVFGRLHLKGQFEVSSGVGETHAESIDIPIEE